jgi:hypothetical protein
MLLDNKRNPFARAAPAGMENKQPQGILNIEAPTAPAVQDDPSVVEQGVGMVKDKALDVAVNKGTEMATSAVTKAAAGAGKGGAAAGAAGGAASTGLMAAAAPMAAPLLIGGLLAKKLFS